MIRHFARHLYQSMFDHIDATLADLGWQDPGGFKQFVVRTQNYLPDETGANAQLEPNLVALTLADEGAETPEEMGDGLVSIEVGFIVDIYGENQAVALAIAEDVKELLRGRLPGTHRIVPIYEYGGDDGRVFLDGVVAENEDVVRMPSTRTELRRQWQVVRWVCRVEYVPYVGSG